MSRWYAETEEMQALDRKGQLVKTGTITDTFGGPQQAGTRCATLPERDDIAAASLAFAGTQAERACVTALRYARPVYSVALPLPRCPAADRISTQ